MYYEGLNVYSTKDEVDTNDFELFVYENSVKVPGGSLLYLECNTEDFYKKGTNKFLGYSDLRQLVLLYACGTGLYDTYKAWYIDVKKVPYLPHLVLYTDDAHMETLAHVPKYRFERALLRLRYLHHIPVATMEIRFNNKYRDRVIKIDNYKDLPCKFGRRKDYKYNPIKD